MPNLARQLTERCCFPMVPQPGNLCNLDAQLEKEHENSQGVERLDWLMAPVQPCAAESLHLPWHIACTVATMYDFLEHTMTGLMCPSCNKPTRVAKG